MFQRWRRTPKSSPIAVGEIRQHGILYSINIMGRSPGLCFSSPVILATQTRKKFARKHFYQWLEIYLHFRVEAHFKRGCCESQRTRRWTIEKKRERRNEVETRYTFQSMQAKLITNRQLIRLPGIPALMRYCKFPRPPAS